MGRGADSMAADAAITVIQGLNEEQLRNIHSWQSLLSIASPRL
jgi:hypothetical protein